MMNLYVKTLSGDTITIDIESDTIILEVKILIARKTSGRVLPKMVIFAGKLLQDDRTISDYNMSKECTVHTLTENDQYFANCPFIYGK
mmetsp:Transcript_33561/g.38145  ORF Transcript_33561/g.38145 Transcript_33561/m.38145 type:complete len:88 (+) Transcript_33561:93-356(+)